MIKFLKQLKLPIIATLLIGLNSLANGPFKTLKVPLNKSPNSLFNSKFLMSYFKITGIGNDREN